MSRNHFYIHHGCQLLLTLDRHFIHDISQLIIKIYHKLLFTIQLDNKIYCDMTKIHNDLIKYVINQHRYKLIIRIPYYLERFHVEFCHLNHLQFCGPGQQFCTHFDIHVKKMVPIELSIPLITINPHVSF